jgi:glycosyltransferase involved in cell wall biosynthesis
VRILQVVPLVDTAAGCGGQLAVVVAQSRELRRRGHEVTIVGAWRGRSAPPREIEGLPAQLLPPGQIAPWLRRHAHLVDLAHVHLTRERSVAVAARTLRGLGIPYLTQTHGLLHPARTHPSRADAALARRAFDVVHTVPTLRGAVRRLAVDAAERTRICHLVASDYGTAVLGYGVPLGPAPHPRRSDGDLEVLFLGRLRPGRGLGRYTEVAVTLIRQGVPARFGVLGPDGGELAPMLELLAGQAALGDRLRYEGALPHPRALERLGRADLLVVPGEVGEPSMALLEALAAGVPVICTDAYPDAAALGRHGAARVVAASSAAVATAVRELVRDETDRLVQGRRGRAAIGQLYDIAIVVDELLGHYQACLDQLPPMVAGPYPAAEARRSPSLRPTRSARPARPTAADLPDRPALRSNGMLWITTDATAARVALWREVGRYGGLTVALTASRPQTSPCDEPFTVLQLDKGSATLRSLLRSRPDALVIDGPATPVFLTAARLARRREVPVVVAFRGDPGATGSIDAAQRRLLLRADAVLVSGSASIPLLLGLGIAADKVTVLAGEDDDLSTRSSSPPDYVGQSGDSHRSDRQDGDAATPADGAAPVIDLRVGHHFGYLGPLVTGANLDALLHAFVRCRAPHDQLTLAGDGPLTESLRALVTTLGVEPVVTLLPDPDAVARADLLERVHTLVLPGPADAAWPAADVVAAVRAGVQLVATDREGLPADLRARPGVFVTAASAKELGEAMAASRSRRPLRLVPTQVRGRSRSGDGASVQ